MLCPAIGAVAEEEASSLPSSNPVGIGTNCLDSYETYPCFGNRNFLPMAFLILVYRFKHVGIRDGIVGALLPRSAAPRISLLIGGNPRGFTPNG
jgi:hypothetical protein